MRIQKGGLAEELDPDRGLDLRLCLLPPGAPSLLSASWSSGCWLPGDSDPVAPAPNLTQLREGRVRKAVP